MRFKCLALITAAVCVFASGRAAAQGLTGSLIGTVKDAQGGVMPRAVVRISSPALIGGPATIPADDKGQWRFPSLSPGLYALDITMPGFAALHEDGIRIAAGATIERTALLKLAGVAESLVVEAVGSRLDARSAGVSTRFGAEDVGASPPPSPRSAPASTRTSS
jgi:hypothetical protein